MLPSIYHSVYYIYLSIYIYTINENIVKNFLPEYNKDLHLQKSNKTVISNHAEEVM